MFQIHVNAVRYWRKAAWFFRTETIFFPHTARLLQSARCLWVCNEWHALSQQVRSQQLYERERTAAGATIMRFQLGKKTESQVVEFLNRHFHYLLHPSLRQPRILPSHNNETFQVFSGFQTAGNTTRKNAWREARKREGYTRAWAHSPFSAVRILSRYSSTLPSSYEIWLQLRLMCQSQAPKRPLNAVWTVHRAKKLENSMHVRDPTHLQRAVWVNNCTRWRLICLTQREAETVTPSPA